MPRTARDVVFVDGVRTPFGKAMGHHPMGEGVDPNPGQLRRAERWGHRMHPRG